MSTQHPHIATLAYDLAAILAPLSREERVREMSYFLDVLAAEHELMDAPIIDDPGSMAPHVWQQPLGDNRRWSLRVARRQALGAES